MWSLNKKMKPSAWTVLIFLITLAFFHANSSPTKQHHHARPVIRSHAKFLKGNEQQVEPPHLKGHVVQKFSNSINKEEQDDHYSEAKDVSKELKGIENEEAKGGNSEAEVKEAKLDNSDGVNESEISNTEEDIINRVSEEKTPDNEELENKNIAKIPLKAKPDSKEIIESDLEDRDKKVLPKSQVNTNSSEIKDGPLPSSKEQKKIHLSEIASKNAQNPHKTGSKDAKHTKKVINQNSIVAKTDEIQSQVPVTANLTPGKSSSLEVDNIDNDFADMDDIINKGAVIDDVNDKDAADTETAISDKKNFTENASKHDNNEEDDNSALEDSFSGSTTLSARDLFYKEIIQNSNSNDIDDTDYSHLMKILGLKRPNQGGSKDSLVEKIEVLENQHGKETHQNSQKTNLKEKKLHDIEENNKQAKKTLNSSHAETIKEKADHMTEIKKLPKTKLKQDKEAPIGKDGNIHKLHVEAVLEQTKISPPSQTKNEASQKNPKHQEKATVPKTENHPKLGTKMKHAQVSNKKSTDQEADVLALSPKVDKDEETLEKSMQDEIDNELSTEGSTSAVVVAVISLLLISIATLGIIVGAYLKKFKFNQGDFYMRANLLDSPSSEDMRIFNGETYHDEQSRYPSWKYFD